jgi:hypothetical protein
VSDQIPEGFAEQLRYPLTDIIGFTQLLADEETGGLNEKQEQYAAEIMRAAAAMLSRINQFQGAASPSGDGHHLEPHPQREAAVRLSSLPTREQVLAFGSKHSRKNWTKHVEFLADNGIDGKSLDRVLNAFSVLDGKRLERRHVFDLDPEDLAARAVAAVVWGFPKGGRPGGIWKPYAEAFGRSAAYARVLADLKSSKVAAVDGLRALDEISEGVGFATTSKMAYFSGVEFREGPALIYDKNVILAIRGPIAGFEHTRSLLGSGEAFWHRGTVSYGAFVGEAAALAQGLGASHPDQVELALFQSLVSSRGRWGAGDDLTRDTQDAQPVDED